MNIFEQATRQKLRFETSLGLLIVEQLWDLPLQHPSRPNLDDIARKLDAKVKASSTPSFVDKQSIDSSEDKLRFDIVIHIINVKLALREKNVQDRERAAKRERIQELIAKKRDQELEGASLEELEKLVSELN